MAMHFNLKACAFSQCIAFLYLSSISNVYAETYSEIPSVSTNIKDIPYLKFYLELVINTYSTQKVVPVIVKADEYFILIKDLKELDLDYAKFTSEEHLSEQDVAQFGLDHNADDWVKFNPNSAEYTLEYQSSNQKLHLNLPTDWLPEQMLGRDYRYKQTVNQSGFGMLNNYNAYLYRPYIGGKVFNLYTEQRVFSQYGFVSNSGIYSSIVSSSGEKSDNYMRYDTTWRFDDENSVYTFELGDIFSFNKNSWASSVRMGGVQIRKNYSMRPDLITYPLPQFKGEVGLPSTVDLFINGLKNSTDQLKPGPFLITNVPYINGRGEAVIVTKDAVGRQTSTTVPFYISGDLVKKGLIDYSLSFGALRQSYGVKNFEYGDLVGSLDARYGIANWVTGEFHLEGNDKVWNAGLGAVVKLNNYGVLNTSYTKSIVEESLFSDKPYKGKGYQFTAGYQYQQNYFGMNASHTRRSEDFFNLASYYSSSLLSLNSSESTNVNLFLSGDKIGTLGLGYFNIKRNRLNATELFSLSWSPPLPKFMNAASVSLTANQDLNDKSWSGALQIAMPLSKTAGRVTVGHQYQEKGGSSSDLNYSYQMPTDGGFGMSLSHKFNEQGSDFNQAQMQYRNNHLNADAGLSGDTRYDYWFGMSGSIAWMKNALFFSNQLGDSFALVRTGHYTDIPILYENNLIGKTNKSGYLIVPNVTPYNTVKYAIDPLNLSSNYSVSSVEQKVSAKFGGGILIDFPLNKVTSASVTLKLVDGSFVPVGSIIHQNGRDSTYVGMDGMAYIEDVDATNILNIALDDGTSCKAQFEAEMDKDEIQNIENIVCELQEK